MDSLRNAIAKVFQSWEALPKIAPDWRIESIQDRERDRYVLQHVSFPGEQHKSHTLAHLTIRDGKIWILTDNTEEGIATELVAAGIPKKDIVLAFYPPAVREMGEFAIR
jgi:XisI protein